MPIILVRSKGDGNGTVRDIFIQNPLCHGHDLGDSRLVVCPEDRVPSLVIRVRPFRSFKCGNIHGDRTRPLVPRGSSRPL